jgi:two-component system, NarL family, sensor histidine kinase NreB
MIVINERRGMVEMPGKQVTSYIIQILESENKRIANELHEGIAQTMYSIFNGLQLIEQHVESEEMRKYIAELAKLSSGTIEDLRWLSTELHPSSLDTHGLISAVSAYLKIFTANFGIMVDIKSTGTVRRLPNSTETTLYRVCQEILSNSAQYADTNQILITFTWEPTQLIICIKDFGIGFDVEEKKHSGKLFGLAAMQKRMSLAGGTLDIESNPNEGTTVSVTVPIQEEKYDKNIISR